jgi:hypothetical protein
VWPTAQVTLNNEAIASVSCAGDAATPCWWYDCKTFSVNVQCDWPKFGETPTTVRAVLSTLPTTMIDNGLAGKIALIDRIVDTLAAQCPPELSEFQELIQAVELSCTLAPAAGECTCIVWSYWPVFHAFWPRSVDPVDIARELSESLQALWMDRMPSAATLLMLAGYTPWCFAHSAVRFSQAGWRA